LKQNEYFSNSVHEISKNEQSGNSHLSNKPIVPILDLSVIHGVKDNKSNNKFFIIYRN